VFQSISTDAIMHTYQGKHDRKGVLPWKFCNKVCYFVHKYLLKSFLCYIIKAWHHKF
jgi:hypothetical protein